MLPVLGVTCRRLTARVLEPEVTAAPWLDSVTAAHALLEELDALSVQDRTARIDEIQALLGKVQSIPEPEPLPEPAPAATPTEGSPVTGGAEAPVAETSAAPAARSPEAQLSAGQSPKARSPKARSSGTRSPRGQAPAAAGSPAASASVDSRTDSAGSGASAAPAAQASKAQDSKAQDSKDQAPRAQAATSDGSADASPQAAAAEPGPSEDGERKRRGRGRRRRRRQSEAASAPEPSPEPAPPLPPRRLPLGHPEGSGRPLVTLAEIPSAEALVEQGVVTIADTLSMAPVRHVRAASTTIEQASLGDRLMVRGRVRQRHTRLRPDGRVLCSLLTGPSGEQALRCRWTGRAPRGWEAWKPGQEIALIGAIRAGDDGGLVLEDAEAVGMDGRGSGLLPEYGLPDVPEPDARDAVATALRTSSDLEDHLPSAILESQRLLGLGPALRDAHFPANASGRGRRRLAFDELFLLHLGLARGEGTNQRGIPHKLGHRAVGRLAAERELTLDDDAEVVFSDIRRELARPRPMLRLIQGDAGAGKGLLALMSGAVVAEGGRQVAMIFPDATAAERRYLFAHKLLRAVGIVPLLCGGAPNHAQSDAIGRGEAHVVFGTPVLLDARVSWKRLGLVVCEVPGLAAEPRLIDPATLRARPGATPDLLVLSQAPLPASVVLSAYGEFAMSILAPRPNPVVCERFTDRLEAYRGAQRYVEAGGQAYVVFPVREGADLLGPAEARRIAEALGAETFPGANVAIYHSSMSRDERLQRFRDLERRRIDVLLCTTHIEDAPKVRNAGAMVIEYADLFSPLRLHRLRSHMGTGGGRSGGTCALILSEEPSAEAEQMVEQVIGEPDGFRLAELELERCPEALAAFSAPDFRWADLLQDRPLLLAARDAARRVLNDDPRLRRHSALRSAIGERWGDWLGVSLPDTPAQPEARRRRRRRRRRR